MDAATFESDKVQTAGHTHTHTHRKTPIAQVSHTHTHTLSLSLCGALCLCAYPLQERAIESYFRSHPHWRMNHHDFETISRGLSYEYVICVTL